MDSGQSRLAGPYDATLLAALHNRCVAESGGESWDASAIGALLTTPGVFAYLAVTDDETPVGLLIGRSGGGESEILTMGILPANRRQGRGLILINAAMAHAADNGADRMFLEVADDNGAAKALYRRGGFRRVGRRAGYYPHPAGPVDAILMRRDFGAPSQGDTLPGARQG